MAFSWGHQQSQSTPSGQSFNLMANPFSGGGFNSQEQPSEPRMQPYGVPQQQPFQPFQQPQQSDNSVPPGVDPEVFQNLPEDLRNEYLSNPDGFLGQQIGIRNKIVERNEKKGWNDAPVAKANPMQPSNINRTFEFSVVLVLRTFAETCVHNNNFPTNLISGFMTQFEYELNNHMDIIGTMKMTGEEAVMIFVRIFRHTMDTYFGNEQSIIDPSFDINGFGNWMMTVIKDYIQLLKVSGFIRDPVDVQKVDANYNTTIPNEINQWLQEQCANATNARDAGDMAKRTSGEFGSYMGSASKR